MSEYHSQTTTWKDKDCVIAGLVAAGYREDQIEIHETPQQLFDYHGQRTRYLDPTGDQANIIIRRNNIGYGAANDFGLKWNEKTGTYDAIVSEYDSGRNHWGKNSDRMKAAKVGYTEARTIKTAKAQGFKFLRKEIVNGKPQLQFMDTRL